MSRKHTAKHSIGVLVQGYRRHICLLSFLTVLESILQVSMALITRFVIDAALSKNGDLPFWSVMLAADILLLVVTHTGISWYSGSTADRVSAGLRRSILKSAVYSNDTKLQGYHSGELLNRGLEDVHTLCDGVVNAFPAMVGQVTRLVAAFASVILIYPPVALVMLIAAGAVGAMAAGMRPILRKQHRQVRESDEKVMANLQENLQQLVLIQSLEIQKPILSRFWEKLRLNLKIRKKRRAWSVGVNGVINSASSIGSGALLLWGVTRVAAGALSYGSLTSMIQLFSQFRGPVLGLSGLWTRLAAVEVAAERLEVLLSDHDGCQQELTQLQNVTAVVFENVTFTYPADEAPVVENFSARFPLDGWTCVTGISGKGKTTLFKLLLGLYTPQKGRVYLQTTDGEVLCSPATRGVFAYVPQDYALLSGTVMDNLRLVAPDVDEQRLRDVLSVAQAEFLLEMSGREQTLVGENNTGLSKGQLQRLAIARAVLMDRPIFLLDECTSALDAETEKAVLQGLKRLGKRAILVTHRPEALSDIEGITSVSMDN